GTMRYGIVAAALLVVGAASAPLSAGGPARPGDDALVEKVRKAIDRGVRFLRERQRDTGSWEVDVDSAVAEGGWTSLTLLALLNAGVPPTDPAVARGLQWLRNLQPEKTYVRALQTMVYAEAGRSEDRERIQANVNWLIEARVFRGNALAG